MRWTTKRGVWAHAILLVWAGCGDNVKGLFSEACSADADCEGEFSCVAGQCTAACGGDDDCTPYADAICSEERSYCYWPCEVGSTVDCKMGTVCNGDGLCIQP